ncbi:FkbM family methyltransferase [Tundrisphaera lichenicola]|uniref:FkbM family methyltransferase n=1 Tax=Tundrisphaera lichenicola TaxID=2029860 RepID=UPI003EBDC516
MSAKDDGLTMHWMGLGDALGKVVSYAQNYEDILLARVFREARGLYIDVGANHPIFHSVTKLFYDRGWRGINIEPSPILHTRLVEDRPEDVNLNVGLADNEGTLTFYESNVYHGWSTFRPELAEHYRGQSVSMIERPVPVTTLAKVCEDHVSEPIDFLKIDAEGFEREVLLGGDFRRWRPRVLVIENSWPEAWEPVLQGYAYRHVAFDGLNRFFVREEDEGLIPSFAATVNVLDNFIPHEIVRLLCNLREERDTAIAELDRLRVRPKSRDLAGRLRSVVHRFGRRAG